MATYHYFKPTTGKWMYSGEGKSLPNNGEAVTHESIRHLNDGMPGILGDGTAYTIVIIDKDSFPRMVLGDTSQWDYPT